MAANASEQQGQNMNELNTKRYWMGSGPAKCDLSDIAPGKHDINTKFVDGKTKMGPWAIMCLRCARERGVGIGQGKGQLYEYQENGKWLKIDG
jgi:hypothetical protein